MKNIALFFLICLVTFSFKTSFAQNNVDGEINELSSIATVLMQQGKFSEALEYFDRILSIDPNDPIALGNKGAALTQLNRHEEALLVYEKALEITPKNTSILNNKAATLFDLGKIDESLQTLDKILEIEPNNVKILILKGNVLLEVKKYIDAFSVFKKAIEIDPTNDEAKKQSYVAINHIRLIPTAGSKYFGQVVLHVRNLDGMLVSVTFSDALGFLPHEITDEYLESSPVKEVVTINDMKYEKREFDEVRVSEKLTFIGRAVLGYDKLGYDVYPFDALPHGITVEKGDTLRAYWTIYRQVD